MADSPPGGNAAAMIVLGPPVVAGIAGYFVGGPEHRVVGVLGGLAAGVIAIFTYSKIMDARSRAAVAAETQPASPQEQPRE